jgi:hypothetical protein
MKKGEWRRGVVRYTSHIALGVLIEYSSMERLSLGFALIKVM